MIRKGLELKMKLHKSPGKKIDVSVIETGEMTDSATSILIQLLTTWVIRDIQRTTDQQTNTLTSNRPILTFVQKDQ